MRGLLLVAISAVLVAAAFAVALHLQGDDASSREREAMMERRQALLRSGMARHESWMEAELQSMRDVEQAGDSDAAEIHRDRLAIAFAAGAPKRDPDGLTLTREAAKILSLDARETDRRGLLEIEAHAMGAGLAFDGIRDALWETADKGLVGSIDERIALVRDELERHRRGEGYVAAGQLSLQDRRRLAGALDALAYRLGLAADRLGA
jgi:hypothetical protein